MFFAILWKNKDISLDELKFIKAQNIKQIDNLIISFETNFPERLNLLWWIIKRWKIVNKDELIKILWNTKLLGTQDKALWIKFKKEYKIKRFKITDLLHTDKEVKEKWKEIIKIKSDFGLVEWYQNIYLYEVIDFDKPARDMKMWMMPSKLTHIMINIWLTNIEWNPTIYDPFAWSWTTWFLTNYFWHNFIWSDIKTNYLLQNLERRQSNKLSKINKFEIFQQDIFQPIIINNENLVIVTEWRLWPIVRDNTTLNQIEKYQKQVIETYKELIHRTHEIKAKRAVFTIPYYVWYDNEIEDQIQNLSLNLWLQFRSIPEIYKRENQKVWRKIIIIDI